MNDKRKNANDVHDLGNRLIRKQMEKGALHREIADLRVRLADNEACTAAMKRGVEARIADMEQAHVATRKRLAEAMGLLSFFASVIRSGEHWTETCQSHYDAVFAASPAAVEEIDNA